LGAFFCANAPVPMMDWQPGEAFLAYLAFLAQKIPHLSRIGQGWLPADLQKRRKRSNFIKIYEIARPPGLAVADRKRLPDPKAGNSNPQAHRKS